MGNPVGPTTSILMSAQADRIAGWAPAGLRGLSVLAGGLRLIRGTESEHLNRCLTHHPRRVKGDVPTASHGIYPRDGGCATIEFLSTVRELARELGSDHELRREAYSMSIYVSIVLLSALSIFDDSHPPGQGEVFLLELGTTVGLVLAHAFASWVSTVMIDGATDGVDQWDLLRVQLAGALAVASLAMVAVVVVPPSIELPAARLTVAVAIGVQVYFESRTSRSSVRAVAYGILALLAGVAVAAVKALLAH
jgi:hypothetical protein